MTTPVNIVQIKKNNTKSFSLFLSEDIKTACDEICFSKGPETKNRIPGQLLCG